MHELRFLTPGIPLSSPAPRSMENGLRRIAQLGLDGMEIEYVRGVILDLEKLRNLGKLARELKLTLTAHAPYYINLFAKEKPKVDKSYQYILDTARALDTAGGYSVVFHAAYYMGGRPEDVYPAVLNHVRHIADLARKEALTVWIRPELMGKRSQFGTLEEVVRLSKDTGWKILPCVDFAHLHARTAGFNSYEDFARVFEYIAKELGDDALRDMHIHFSGIRYSDKGEQKHVIMRDSDFRHREFLKCLKDFDVCGAIVCESPNGEGDTLWMKRVYQSM